MIDQVDLMRVIENLRGDAVVVPVMRANMGWVQVSDSGPRDVPSPTAMGKGSSFALGLALARPDTKVILLDGDGSLVMNLGTLVTVANKAPQNLYHFVMDNGVYATTGGQPVPGAGVTSYTELARAAGYARSYEFDDLEEFTTRAKEVLNQAGPVLVWIKTVPTIRYSAERAEIRRGHNVPRRPSEAIKELMAELGTNR